MFSSKPRRAAAIMLGGATFTVLVAGAAIATTPGSTTDVTFIPVNHRVLNGASVGVGHATSPVVIGGSTTVPTDATTVSLNVVVKSTGTGSLAIYPASDPAGASGDTVSWAGTKGGVGRVAENIGTSNEVTFVNNSTRTIYLTVTIVGYSTQVSEADINGSGGTRGQVLTNTGTGASWQTPGTIYTMTQQGVFISTLYASSGFLHPPAGTYLVEATGTIAYQGHDTTVQCGLLNGSTNSDDDVAWASVTGAAPDASIALHAVATVTSDLEFLALRCQSPFDADLRSYTLTAMPIGTVHVQSGD